MVHLRKRQEVVQVAMRLLWRCMLALAAAALPIDSPPPVLGAVDVLPKYGDLSDPIRPKRRRCHHTLRCMCCVNNGQTTQRRRQASITGECDALLIQAGTTFKAAEL